MDNSWAEDLSDSDHEDLCEDTKLDDPEPEEEEEEDYDAEDDYDDEYGDQVDLKRRRASKKASQYYNVERFFGRRENRNRVIMNVYCTEYDVVKKAARKMNKFKIIEVIENPDGGVV